MNATELSHFFKNTIRNFTLILNILTIIKYKTAPQRNKVAIAFNETPIDVLNKVVGILNLPT